MKKKCENIWEWSEPSNEEFEKRRMKENFYKIYFIDSEGKHQTVYKFWAKDDNFAYRMLNKFKKFNKHTGVEYFYSLSGYFIDSNGGRFDSLYDGCFSKIESESLFHEVFYFFTYRLPEKIKNILFEIKDVFYYIKHKHSIRETWSIDKHMLQDLKFNLEKLAENHYGVPQFIIDRIKKDSNCKNDDTLMELASKEWKRELLELRNNIMLYFYYENYGIIDENDYEMIAIDAVYRKTIPYKPGTYKELDYVKLSKLQKKYWNKIWNWIKEYGESLWD
jgi:hypothetical protein